MPWAFALSDRERSFAYLGLLVVILSLCFYPCLSNSFLITWDDAFLVIRNPLIRDLSFRGIFRIFSSTQGELYVPLAYLSYAVEYFFFGLRPSVYHLTNVLLHIFNVWLVYILFRKLKNSSGASFLAALLFGLHPMTVESVAWISERKDVLYFFFSVASFLFYIFYAKSREGRYYLAALFCYLLGLLSKPVAVTLPVIFILFDTCLLKKRVKDTLLDKIPFFILAILFFAFTLLMLWREGHIRLESNRWWSAIPLYSFLFYFIKMTFPIRLSFCYPFPQNGDVLLAVAPLFFAGVVAALFFLRKKKSFIFGFLFFAVSLLPALQIVPLGHTPVADRYAYFSAVGLFFLAAKAMTALFSCPTRKVRILAAAGALILFSAYFMITHERCKAWKDDWTLYTDGIAKFPNVRMNYRNRAKYLFYRRDFQGALADIDQAIRLDPNYAFDYQLRAKIYGTLGDYKKSLNNFSEALSICPTCYKIYNDRGVTYGNYGRYPEAIKDFKKAILLKLDFSEARLNLRLARAFEKLETRK